MTSRNQILSVAMIGLMLLSTTLVHAAAVSTFANGDPEVTVELRDQGIWGDDLTAGINLPAGETVNAAGLIVGTDAAYHDDVTTIDSSVLAEIWNPLYNGGMTQYSSAGDFTVEEEYLKLTSLGYNADFEASQEGWTPGAGQGPEASNWMRGHESDTYLQGGCGVGEYCWGTDFESPDYNMVLPSGEYEYTLISASFFVHPGKSDLSFKSFHSLFYRPATTTSYYYDDCAYVAVMNSTNNANFNSAVFEPFDQSGTTGVSASNGLYQLGNQANQVPNARCNYLGADGPQTGDYVLGGNGTTSANSPSGWSNIKIDLFAHQGRYVKLLFVLEVNDHSGGQPAEPMSGGWYIDGVRVGDPLPAQGHVVIQSFASGQSGQPGSPDGYGLLQLDMEMASSSDFSVDILAAGSGALVYDVNGNPMTNLQGNLIELWDIDADTYPLIDLKFSFGSGPARLSSPVVHGFHIGTRIGTTFNNTDGVFMIGGGLGPGKWISSMGENSAVMVTANIVDDSFSPALVRSDFSMPIVAIKPIVVDSCGGPAALSIMSMNEDEPPISGTSGQWTELSAPTFTFAMMANYTTMCDVFSIHADVRFAHHSRGITLDVAGDGDVEWGMTEPAFGRFGRQDTFRTGLVNDINQGDSKRTVSLDINLHAEGAPFLLPKGATVSYAEMSIENNNIGAFNMSLFSGNQEELIGTIDGAANQVPVPTSPLVSMQSHLQSLLDNPLVPTAWIDGYGNEWYLFRISIDSDLGTAGSSVTFRDLEVIYDWSRAISDGNNIAREMNQGVALAGGSTGDVIVPMRIIGGSGGAMALSSLSVSTTSGYDSTLDDGGLEGMYPNGDIIEIITTHDVAASTGQTLGGASLLFETANGNMELRWDATNGSFWEESDVGDKIDFMATQSLETDASNGGTQLHWRFRVNAAWDDTKSVRIYGAALSNTGVNGLPAGVLIEPVIGNAVENDAGITEFHLYNQGGVEQLDLANAYSSNVITLDFTIRYEDLEFAPNPNSYDVVLEKRNQSNVSEEWLHVDTVTAAIDGNYSWQPAIPSSEAGTEQFRLMIANYTDGDTLCPPTNYTPDADCAIRFAMTLDPFAPHLLNISVFSVQGDWRDLADDTWVPSSNNQKFRVLAQDLPEAPEFLTLNYWVEADQDCGLDALCPGDPGYTGADSGELDRNAQVGEYLQIPLERATETDTSYYYIDHPCQCISDYANSGIDPPQMVSLYVSGGDIGGNQIDGGLPGVNEDLVTYIGMDSRAPGVDGFRISDSHGTMLNEVNRSVYAGNIYHLLVDAHDANGWRDVNWTRVTLNPLIANPNLETYDPDGAIEIYYSPRNDTAWTDSTLIEIIDDYENTGLKPVMLQRNGGILISPFEQDFTLSLPIRFDWSVPASYVAGVMTPAVCIKDMDESHTTPGCINQNRNPQRWSYASGIQLDTTTFDVDDTSGYATQGVGDASGGFVNRGDILVIDGRYVFSAGMNDLIFVSPEIDLTLRITRTPIYPNGEVDLPGSGYIPAQTSYEDYPFENGSFTLVVSAPIYTNEYTFTLELLGLPEGALDTTPTPSKSFVIKVDGDAPEAVFGSWELSNPNSGEAVLDGRLSSSVMGCLDAEVYIDEKQQMDVDSVSLNWMFFQTQEVGGFEYNWTTYLTTFTAPYQSVQMNLDSGQGRIRTTATCIDLWPGEEIPTEMNNVLVKFWITGHDTAGTAIDGAGQFGASVDGQSGIFGLEFEAAVFTIVRKPDLSVDNPMAETNFDLLIDVRNDGNQEGSFTIQIVTYIGDDVDSPVTYTCPESLSPGESYLWKLDMPQFPGPATNVHYLIMDEEGNELETSKSFNVAKFSDEEQGLSMVLIGGIIGAAILLIIAVVVVLLVLNKSTAEEEDDFIEEDDFLPAGEAVAPIRSRGPPATRAGDRRGPPGSASGPPAAAAKTPMQIAQEKFPHWDEATIQGYFDQGWSVEQLEEWVASQ